MKRFVYAVFGFVGIVAAILVCLISLSFMFRDKTRATSMVSEIGHKVSYLASLKSPKVIIIGGSGCSHGINSPDLEAALGMPVVNTGVHAGLGLAYQLLVVSQYVHPGDLAVIIPEYPNFINCLGDGTVLPALLDVRPEDWKFIDWKLWVHLLQYMPRYSLEKIGHLVASPFMNQTNSLGRVYGGWAYNHHGDMISAWSDARNLGVNVSRNDSHGDLPHDFGVECIARIKSFKEKHPGTHIVILPPAYHEIAFENDITLIRRAAQLLATAGIPFIATPERYRMANSECWDSVYHLNGMGIRRRTRMMIEDLSQFKSPRQEQKR